MRMSALGAAHTRPATMKGTAAMDLRASRRCTFTSSTHELRRRQEQRVPFLWRGRQIEYGTRRSAQRGPQHVQVERVLNLRKRRMRDCLRLWGLEQAGRIGTDLARNLETRRHLARSVPGWRRHGISVRRRMIIESLGEPVEPSLDRGRI